MKHTFQKLAAVLIAIIFFPVTSVYAGTYTAKNWVISCGSDTSVQTALGCFDAKGSFVQKLLNYGFGIVGGIAFFLILYGGFQIIISSGNPEKLNEGKEIVTAAIVGLLFVLFSVFILRFIGFDVLQLPGFN